MEGALSKWTNVVHGWQYRWFVLGEDALLYYTSKEKMSKGQRGGFLRLHGAIVGIDGENNSLFTITVDGKMFHLRGRDQRESDSWVKALEAAIRACSIPAEKKKVEKFEMLSTQVTPNEKRTVDDLLTSSNQFAEGISPDRRTLIFGEDENQFEIAQHTPEVRPLRFSQDDDEDEEEEEEDVAVDESPARIYPRLSMYRRLSRHFEEALNVSGSQQLREEQDMESVMAGVVALIESRCCEEATTIVRKRLRKMGATINRAPSTAVTHIIWSNGGDSSGLRAALDACADHARPHVLPPAWVHECYQSSFRHPEAAFSLCDERYVSGLEKRSSSVVHAAPPAAANLTSSTIDVSMSINESDGNRTEFSDLTFDATMSVTQLLAKIDIMAKRLEKVEVDPIQHAIRCRSRAAAASPAARQQRVARPTYQPRPLPRPLRRRSHDGFSLAHRQEEYDEEERRIRLASRDVLEGLPPLQPPAAVPSSASGAAVVDGVEDMRRTVETDLVRIRQTLRNNANYSRVNGVSMRGGRGGRGRGAHRLSQYSFLLPTSPRSPGSPTSTTRRGRPSAVVVKTQSKMINKLQMSSGFVSSSELDEERKKRQEEWQKVRTAADPLDAPEGEVCNKSLFEKLKHNKDKKDLEFQEEIALKNLVRGIDEDESQFLSMVNDIQRKDEKAKKEEEVNILKQMKELREKMPDDLPQQADEEQVETTRGHDSSSATLYQMSSKHGHPALPTLVSNKLVKSRSRRKQLYKAFGALYGFEREKSIISYTEIVTRLVSKAESALDKTIGQEIIDFLASIRRRGDGFNHDHVKRQIDIVRTISKLYGFALPSVLYSFKVGDYP